MFQKKSSAENSKKSHSDDEIEAPKKRYISPEERRQIIDELTLDKNMIIEYQQITNLLDNTLDQPFKLRTRNWVEINNESYNTGSGIKFKNTMLWSNLCDYADAYILVKATITITGAEDDDAAKPLD